MVRASSSWLDDSTPTLVMQEMTEKGQSQTGNDLASWASRDPTLTLGALETAVASGSSMDIYLNFLLIQALLLPMHPFIH